MAYKNIFIEEKNGITLTNLELQNAVKASLTGKKLSKVLIIPPDFTRFYSNAGLLTNYYYHELVKQGTVVDILPALGTHDPMTTNELDLMFGDIPHDRFIVHDWRHGVTKIGEVPAAFLSKVSDGIWQDPIEIEINKIIMDPSYDLIISIGQIVPHEVVGIANYSKNIFVGCGGRQTINKSHMLGAVYGMEKMMGKDHTPVREMLDYALNHILKKEVLFVLTVTTAPQNVTTTHGLYIGTTREGFEQAITMVQKKNLDVLAKPLQKVVVYLEEKEFKSTWLGNKAVYRTRMAIADGGELIILAPGVTKFGEDEEIDRLIRKYGYVGRDKTLALYTREQELQDNMSVAAHLIHGSSDGRFMITYAVKKISLPEISAVNFKAASFDELSKIYDPETLLPGYNKLRNGEEIFYIPNPALGLWISEDKL